jgi:hypothetical protein
LDCERERPPTCEKGVGRGERTHCPGLFLLLLLPRDGGVRGTVSVASHHQVGDNDGRHHEHDDDCDDDPGAATHDPRTHEQFPHVLQDQSCQRSVWMMTHGIAVGQSKLPPVRTTVQVNPLPPLTRHCQGS